MLGRGAQKADKSATGTVQKQYTAGPLQIVRWANIINAHIFPGPSIITTLSSAATDAVTAYNTSVETSISGPPASAYDSSTDPEEIDTPEEPLVEAREEVEEQDGDRESSDSEDTGEDEDDFPDPEPSRRLSAQDSSFPDRSSRKLSVVSVSTTISTKTESIGPHSAPIHHRTVSNPTTPVGQDNDISAALIRLGAPPMARSLLLLAQMSSEGNLLNAEYTSQCLDQARKNPDFVMGFIAQKSLNNAPRDNFITMTPGVQIGNAGDGMGQQYNTPETVVRDAGTDVVIVGRGIYAASDRKQKAEEYRARSWRAYEERVANKGR